jgi:hypothetical protein
MPEKKGIWPEAIEACLEKVKAKIDANRKEMKSWKEEMKAYTEKREANPEEMKSVAVHEEVLEEAIVKTGRALRKWHGDQHLASGCGQKLKKWTQGNGGFQKRLAVPCRGMTHCARVVRHKEHCRQGQGKDSVVQRTWKEWTSGKRCWTQPECNNSMRNPDLKELLHRGSKRYVNETFRKTLGLEITKRFENKCQDITEESAATEMKEEATNSRSRAMDVGALTIIGTSAPTNQKSRMMVIHLDRHAPYEGTAQDERP